MFLPQIITLNFNYPTNFCSLILGSMNKMQRPKMTRSLRRSNGYSKTKVKANLLSLTKARGSKIRRKLMDINPMPRHYDRTVIAPAVLGVTEAVALLYLGPPGTDIFAHYLYLYIFTHHGLSLWNNLWYEGTYSFVGYSILPYVVASVLGLRLTELVGIVITLSFVVQLDRSIGSPKTRLATQILLLTWPFVIESGDVPYVLGCASIAAAALAYLKNKKLPFLIATLLALLSSPLAVGFFAIFIVSYQLIDPFRTRSTPSLTSSSSFLGNLRAGSKRLLSFYLVVLAIEVGIVLLLSLGFPTQNFYPFFLSDFVIVVAFALLVILVSAPQPTKWSARDAFQRLTVIGALLYLLTALVLMIVPTPIGANLNKISEISLPLSIVIVASARAKTKPIGSNNARRRSPPKVRLRRTPAYIALLILSSYWTFTEVSGPLTNTSQAYKQGNYHYWEPVINYLKAHLSPGQRVEVVDTPTHAQAYYLPRASIPLVRGWFRQADFPENRLLYRTHLPTSSYKNWLGEASAAYIVLTEGPYDFSANNEAKLLSSSHSFLTLVFRDTDVKIYKIRNATPLVSNNAGTVSLGLTDLKIKVLTPGPVVVNINYSPYLIPSSGCISYLRPGTTLWEGAKVGVDTLHFGFKWSTFINTVRDSLVSHKSTSCTSS